MGANISIKEGGKGRVFTAQRLRTLQSGGGAVDWVPESETRTKTLNANENGTYAPAADGVYAFDEVRVNVPEMESFTGKGKDGNDYHYKKRGGGGGGSGEVEVTELPSYIKVITPPTVVGDVYSDGQKIVTDGMVVKAYYSSDEEYGVVPNGEIELEPSVAQYDAETVSGRCILDGDEIDYGILPLKETRTFFTPPSEVTYTLKNVAGSVIKCVYIVEINKAYIMSETQDLHSVVRYEDNDIARGYYGPNELIYSDEEGSVYANIYSNKDYSNSVAKYEYFPHYPPVSLTDEMTREKIAKILFRGADAFGSHQIIKVRWPRPHDGKILVTEFEIIVREPEKSGGSGGGGSGGTSYDDTY